MTDIFCILRLVDTIWYGSVRSIRWIIVRDIIRQYVLSGNKEDTAQNTINIEMSIRMNISTTSFLLFPYKKFYAAIWVSMQRVWVRYMCIYLSLCRERERERDDKRDILTACRIRWMSNRHQNKTRRLLNRVIKLVV